MALLEFATAEVALIVAHARTCTRFMRKWDGETTHPCLILAVDQGVYLMSNGLDGDTLQDASLIDAKRTRAFAKGICPKTDPNWMADMKSVFGSFTGVYYLDIVPAVEQIAARGYPTLMVSTSNHSVSVFDPTLQTVLIGQTYKTPSGLGGVFHVRILELSATHALVQNHGNCEDFDDALPYRVPLDKIYPIDKKGAA